MMNMKKISPRLQKSFIAAQEEGRKCGSTELLPEHVLLAILKSADGLGYIMLQDLRVNVLTFQLKLEQAVMPRPVVSALSELPPSRRLRTVLDIAALESNSMRNDYVGTEHFLLAAFREENSTSNIFLSSAELDINAIRDAARTVQYHFNSSAGVGRENFGSTLQRLAEDVQRQTVAQFSSSSDQNSSRRSQKNISFLSEFSRDLTQLSREKKLDPVVGRTREIDRLIQILSRRTKNNPVLVGEPGVGKTAVIEGLAARIAGGEVPFSLMKKRLLALDMVAVVAGTRFRGDFEERMKRIMKEIREDGNIILFIDELHSLVGAGGSEGGMDASNILKPALSRGELQLIGATTTKEYRKYFEKDSALERRFQRINVSEPAASETVEILNGLKKKYEDYHGVVYDEDVIPAIVKFSERYIPERFLPDKAIDILDEAGSAKKISGESRPVELAEMEKAIEELTAEKKQLVASQNYEKAAEVRDRVRELKQKLENFSEIWQNGSESFKKHVTVEDICRIVSSITGIPLEQLDSSEADRLIKMEDSLHQSVIGQDEAIRVLASAIRRSRAGISSPDRPLGSFIFLGPTGVGKTQLAKSLAQFLFGSKDALIRIDMSDYMEKHNASRLVGAPPGYVGFDEGGLLTEKVRRQPYSVILLDEIEKAHPDIFNLLLQLLEEGELSDSLGHTVNFRNTVIIMTGNAGARQITSDHRLGFSPVSDGVLPYTEIKANALEELKRIMRPELLNRVDDVVVFEPLTREQISKILDLQVADLEKRLADKNLTLEIKPKARDYLVLHGYDSNLGARPMRRLLQSEIEEPLALLILEGKAKNGSKITVDFSKEKIRVKIEEELKTKVAKKTGASRKRKPQMIQVEG